MGVLRRQSSAASAGPGTDVAAWLGGDDAGWFGLLTGAKDLESVWQQHGERVLAEWIEDHPGTRPHRWWDYDAPRFTRAHPFVVAHPDRWPYLEGCPSVRKRISGIGTPLLEILPSRQRFAFGLPVDWCEPGKAAFYAMQAPRGVRPVAFDPHDPPLFESQAAFLDRHGLMTATERRRLGSTAWEPEAAMAFWNEHEKLR